MPEEKSELKGRRRAASFMLALDSETAAMIMQKLSEREMAMLTEEMSRIGELTGGEMEKLLKEFNKMTGGDRVSVEPMLQAILERALGKEKAKELLEKIRRQSRETEPFRSLLPLDAKQVATILRGEHPQVLALVISHLDAAIAAALLKDMDENLRFDVIKRISTTEELPTELVRQVDEMMEVRAFSLSQRRVDDAGESRYKTVAQMLNISDPSIAKAVLDRLTRETPQIANEVQALMFVFDDLVKISDRDIQKVLAEVDKNDLMLSLRAATPEVQAKLMNNLSQRARDNMKEEMEMMGARPLSEIEEAQKRILQQVRALEEKGDIRINRGNQEALV
jgi:flagellar motor switch protein FliG